jgi:hypothetical protein
MFYILLGLGIGLVPMIWVALHNPPHVTAVQRKRLVKRKAHLLNKKDRITYWQEFHPVKFELITVGIFLGTLFIGAVYF